MTPRSKAHFKAAPLAVLILVTLSLSGCSTSSSIQSDSSPSFAAVKTALAQSGVHSCNLRFSSGGTFCDRHIGDPSEATVYTNTPASFFGSEVSVAKALHNSVWANGRTIVAVASPSPTLVTALDRNGFSRYEGT